MHELHQTLEALIAGFHGILHEKDEYFLRNMQRYNLKGDEISRYQFWEWPQGIGLFALTQLWQKNRDPKQLMFLTSFYDQRIREGLPAKNINTMAPILALSLLAKERPKPSYLSTCREWAEWAMHELPRTAEGGFQHITSDTINNGELWDDTLMMAVAPLATIGVLLDEKRYQQEAIRQVRIHAKYLQDKTTGLWFHGYSFIEHSNFSGSFWGRGNCWVTISLPFLMETLSLNKDDYAFFSSLLTDQAHALKACQDTKGMWHTLLDDSSSYLEASATCGFAYGLLRSQRLGFLDSSYQEVALRALSPIMDLIDDEGSVSQVSYGTPMGRTDKDFYKQIPLVKMPYGTALALLYLIEAQHAE
ncbi:MAG: glycoside hydrolase family 88/105 protein [Sphaerochaetaceae bacterium]